MLLKTKRLEAERANYLLQNTQHHEDLILSEALTFETSVSNSAGIKEIYIGNHPRILGHASRTGNLSCTTAVYHQNVFHVQNIHRLCSNTASFLLHDKK